MYYLPFQILNDLIYIVFFFCVGARHICHQYIMQDLTRTCVRHATWHPNLMSMLLR